MKKKKTMRALARLWQRKNSEYKNIHLQLEETIAQRGKILAEWQKLFLPKTPIQKNIHDQLKETIEALRRERRQIIVAEKRKRVA